MNIAIKRRRRDWPDDAAATFQLMKTVLNPTVQTGRWV